MDHLKSSQERRDRWYARNLLPKYVPVQLAETWDELWEENTTYDSVKSIPYPWLCGPLAIEGGEQLVKFHDSIANKMKRLLDRHGFLVISGVLKKDECAQAMAAAWDWIEAASDAEQHLDRGVGGAKIPPVQRGNLATLESDYFPRSVEGGMMPFYGSGHSKFAWLIRSNPKVKRVFEAFYKDDKLMSSIDGIVLWRSGSKASCCSVENLQKHAKEVSKR